MLLNADIGEGFDDVDHRIVSYLNLANIACGGHAGTQASIEKTVSLACASGVSVGAHPSYIDRVHFGRVSVDVDMDQLEQQLVSQISLVAEACEKQGVILHHIKAHGALYNDSNIDPSKMSLLLRLAQQFNCKLMIQSLPQMSHTLTEATNLDVPLIREGFADRAYLSSGALAPRSQVGAVFENLDDILKQAIHFQNAQPISCLNSDAKLSLDIDSLCVHGDNQLALSATEKIYNVLH